MGQTAENLAQAKDISREDMDHFGVRSQNLAEQAIKNGFAREITPITRPDGSTVDADDGRGRRHVRGGIAAQAGVPAGRTRHRRQLLSAQRRGGRADRHE